MPSQLLDREALSPRDEVPKLGICTFAGEPLPVAGSAPFQKAAEIPKARSSWIAVSGVIAARPLAISLMVFSGRAIRRASSA